MHDFDIIKAEYPINRSLDCYQMYYFSVYIEVFLVWLLQTIMKNNNMSIDKLLRASIGRYCWFTMYPLSTRRAVSVYIII